jgi:Ca2+-binding EF-hand superfamily protein
MLERESQWPDTDQVPALTATRNRRYLKFMNPLKSPLLAAALLITAGAAFAQESTPRPAADSAPPPRINRAELIRQFDGNGDGVLDEQERAAARAAVTADDSGPSRRNPRGETSPAVRNLFERWDTNGDGVIDTGEREAARKQLANGTSRTNTNSPARIQRPPIDRSAVIKQHDKDGDGQLSDEERQAALTALREQMRTPRSSVSRGDVIKRFDTNGDGVIDTEERQAAREKRLQPPPASPSDAHETKGDDETLPKPAVNEDD